MNDKEFEIKIEVTNVNTGEVEVFEGTDLCAVLRDGEYMRNIGRVRQTALVKVQMGQMMSDLTAQILLDTEDNLRGL